MDIVSWTFQNDQYDGNEPLYIDSRDPSRSLSRSQARTLVRQLVAGLTSHGLARGDGVCMMGFNDIHYTSLYLGIIGSGGCFTGANPGYTAPELIHHLRITQAKFLLTELKTLDVATRAADACGIPRSHVFVLNYQGECIPAGYQSWDALLSCGELDWVRVGDAANAPAAYVSTSGTSGLPKAAIITHSYLVSQAAVLAKFANVEYKISYLIALPPFHVFTIPLQHALPLREGNPVYVMSRFEPQRFVEAVERFQITQTVVVPPIMTSLSKSEHCGKLGSLRRIYVGGSCASGGMQEQLYSKLSAHASIEHVYGMTETGWASTSRDYDREMTGSVGSPLPGLRLRLVDREGNIIRKDDVKGEIHIRTPHPMKGYLNNAMATAEAFSADGWIRSGDVGYVRDRKWYVVDRSKDLIKVRGWQVSPAEIESALLENPDIIDAGVIGVAAKDGSGEVPRAFVVKHEQSALDESAVKTFLDGRLSRYKQVETVNFVDRIPRNPTGKILRRVLRDLEVVHPPVAEEARASSSTTTTTTIKEPGKYPHVQGAIEYSPQSWDSSTLTDATTIETSSSSSSFPSSGATTPPPSISEVQQIKGSSCLKPPTTTLVPSE